MTTTTTTIFATRKPNAIDRIKGFFFRAWFMPYANLRKRYYRLYGAISIMCKRCF